MTSTTSKTPLGEQKRMHCLHRMQSAAVLIIAANILGCEAVDNNRPAAAPLTPLQSCFADIKSSQVSCTLGAFSAAERFGGPISQQRLQACDQLRMQQEAHCMRMEQFRRELNPKPIAPPQANQSQAALGSGSNASARIWNPSEIAFELRNTGQIPIIIVYAVPASHNGWSTDLLRGRRVLPGDRIWIRPDVQQGCQYKIWITYAEGRSYGSETKNLCGVRWIDFGRDS